ncbi:MAG: hypothetical protein FD177_210 [Desulfovibrionaceae bacterium]|nr:MAG: hypothetical protein FD177_210 [Desulfovibrionaceae bacterium]
MPSEIRNKYRSPVTVQASNAITANAFSAGTQTVIDNTSSGNGGGCNDLELYANVSAAPATAATAELYMQASQDGGTTYSAEVFRGVVAIPVSVTGDYYFGRIMDVPEFCKLKIKAISYGFTASLIAVPVVMEAQ